MPVSSPRQLEPAWRRQYEGLAQRITSLIPSSADPLVEIGCGRGQLTIPLARVCRALGVVVDAFTGPYSEDLRALTRALRREGLSERIRVTIGKWEDWIAQQAAYSYGGVISSGLLPELTSDEVTEFLSGCHRILKEGGVTLHTFLSPVPRNRRQALAIEADSDPRWTMYPPREWFSPPEKLIKESLVQEGFAEVRIIRIPSRLRVVSGAAYALLKEWNVKGAFQEAYRHQLENEGLEIPDWFIVTGRKMGSTVG